jgi:hypothetical protein
MLALVGVTEPERPALLPEGAAVSPSGERLGLLPTQMRHTHGSCGFGERAREEAPGGPPSLYWSDFICALRGVLTRWLGSVLESGIRCLSDRDVDRSVRVLPRLVTHVPFVRSQLTVAST